MFLPLPRITELNPLLFDDFSHLVVVDVLFEAVHDVELGGEDRDPRLVSQYVRYCEISLAILTKLWPVLTDLVRVTKF